MKGCQKVDTRGLVAHEQDLEWETVDAPGEFAIRRKRLGNAAGARELGCSLTEIPPGRRSWPYHFHWGNEEAIYVLGGHGRLRLGGDEIDVVPGDYICLPRGPRGAHQLVNIGSDTLRYLCFSTMKHPDISVYPDSGKTGLFAGSAPGGPLEERTLTHFQNLDQKTDCWEGEPGSEA